MFPTFALGEILGGVGHGIDEKAASCRSIFAKHRPTSARLKDTESISLNNSLVVTSGSVAPWLRQETVYSPGPPDKPKQRISRLTPWPGP